LAAALAEEAPGPLLVVTPRSADLDELCDDLALFSPQAAEVFPAWETTPDERLARDETYGERLRMLKQLCRSRLPSGNSPADKGPARQAAHTGSGEGPARQAEPTTAPKLIVTSIQGLLQPVPSIESVAANTRYLRVGERIDLDELRRWLVEHKFHHTSAVELPGEFSSRGGILDLFAPDWIGPGGIVRRPGGVDPPLRRGDPAQLGAGR
jgi:transcription-repair coupling factor (superfamily II helicase)